LPWRASQVSSTTTFVSTQISLPQGSTSVASGAETATSGPEAGPLMALRLPRRPNFNLRSERRACRNLLCSCGLREHCCQFAGLYPPSSIIFFASVGPDRQPERGAALFVYHGGRESSGERWCRKNSGDIEGTGRLNQLIGTEPAYSQWQHGHRRRIYLVSVFRRQET